jgi:hypothetical protein
MPQPNTNLCDFTMHKHPSLANAQALQILDRVHHYLIFDEPYNPHWGDAVEDVQKRFCSFEVIDLDLEGRKCQK